MKTNHIRSHQDSGFFIPSIFTQNLNKIINYKYLLFTIFLGLWSLTSFSQNPLFEWAHSIGGIGDDAGNSISTDNFGNIYIAGSFQDTVDFDPGPEEKLIISQGKTDIFILKLNASGNLLWALSFGNQSIDTGKSVSTDASGNVYLTGSYSGTIDFDPGAGIYNLTGDNDIYILKLDPSGNFLWAASIGSSSNDRGYSLCTDSFGNLFVTGFYSKIVDFDPGTGVFNLNADAANIFVLKLDTDGNFLWAGSTEGLGGGIGLDIHIDDQGNILLTGLFVDALDFDPSAQASILSSHGIGDAFILKLSEDLSGTGIIKNDFGPALSVFPNPTSGNIKIDLGDSYREVELSIRNLHGQIIQRHQAGNVGFFETFLDSPRGLYTLEIQAANKKSAVVKVLINQP